MARPKLAEHRFDFRGGRNSNISRILMQPNELADCTNVRLDKQHGVLRLRLGSRRLHQTAIGGGAPIDGVYQWLAGGTKQLVAVADGDIHYKTTDFGAWTSVSPTPALGTELTSFATMRADTSGAPLRLYLADGNDYLSWDGSSLATLSGTNSLTNNVEIVRAYHVRIFMKSGDFENHVFWTVLGDPTDGSQGLATLGGAAMVDVLRGERITAMEVIGSSLLVGTEDSIVRFTGYDSSDIQIEQDTEGISSITGPSGKNGLVRADKWAGMVAESGIYAVDEDDFRHISDKWDDFWRDSVDRSLLASAAIAYHEAQRQLWVALPGTGDSGENRTVMVFDLTMSAWFGPWTYPFGIRCLAPWEDSNGDEYLVAGCEDGFVRVLDYDTGGLDNVAYNASGGSAISGQVDFAPTFFNQVGPGVDKVLRHLHVHALANSGETITPSLRVDQGDWTALTTISPSVTGTTSSKPHRVDVDEQGDLFQVRLAWTDADIQVSGFTMRGHSLERPSG